MTGEIVTEEDRRRFQLEALWDRIDSDPSWFSRDVLGLRLWGRGDEWQTPADGQIQVAQAIRQHQCVGVAGCNGSGKTTLFGALALEFIQKPGRVMLLAASEEQLEQTTWPKFERFVRQNQAKIPIQGRLLEKSYEIAPEWDIQAVVSKNKTRITGRHPDRLLIIADEGMLLSSEMFFAFDTMLQNSGCKILVGLNPDHTNCAAYRIAYRDPRWKWLHLSALDHPNVRLNRQALGPGTLEPGWVDLIRNKYGEDSPEWYSSVLGRFPENLDHTSHLIIRSMLEVCASIVPLVDDAEAKIEEQRDLGFDPGRSLDRDPSTICFVECGIVKEVRKRKTANTMAAIGWVKSVAEELGVPKHRIRIDCIGIGGPICDKFWEDGWDVDAVNFAEAPKLDWIELTGDTIQFGRRRAELYWVARMLLQSQKVSIPARFGQMWQDLTTPEYRYDSAGRVVLTSKDDIRKLLGRSPDDGDAFVLTLSRSNSAACKPWSVTFQ